MGLTEEEIARPFVGLVSAGNDSAPCNTTLDARRMPRGAGSSWRRHAAPIHTITVTDGSRWGTRG
ncbi:MAG: hypothetical protein WDN44_02590 [Sphingomonas sp.]